MHNPNLISRRFSRARQHIAKALAVGALSLVAASAVQADAALPGKGTTVQPIQSSIAEEAFQTILVSKGAGEAGLHRQSAPGKPSTPPGTGSGQW